MHSLKSTRCLISVPLVLGLFGCTDHPTASDPYPQTSAADFFDRAPAPGFGALEWRAPVGPEVRVLQEIGPAGGIIHLWGTGVEIRFPEGAVSESVLIEARALPGSVVAFEFGADGLTFGAPVEIRIDHERLTPSWLEWGEEEVFEGDDMRRYLVGLAGVYFEGASTSAVTPLETLRIYMDDEAVVLEIMGDETVFPETEYFRSEAGFRGYAVASM